MSKCSHVQIPPLSALESTFWGRIEDCDEFDDVRIDAELCASANAKNFGFSAALNAETKISLERGPARLNSNWKGLAAESVT
jgi:hypothetical protein